jgi:1,4-dihydroxy-2-naphthoyl-CoA hydrolase
MFVWRTTVKLHDTDAAGLLFYGHQFRIAHDCYEAMMMSIGFPLSAVIRECDFALPIVHAEADYKRALFVDDPLELNLRLEHVGASSYTLFHEIKAADGGLVGTVRTVHVAVDKKAGKKTPLPEKLRAALQRM